SSSADDKACTPCEPDEGVTLRKPKKDNISQKLEEFNVPHPMVTELENRRPSKLKITLRPSSLDESSQSYHKTSTPSVVDVVGISKTSPYCEDTVTPLRLTS
ncbi:hypothetical protein Dimus_030368, partial [Dionaea muscipula]